MNTPMNDLVRVGVLRGRDHSKLARFSKHAERSAWINAGAGTIPAAYAMPAMFSSARCSEFTVLPTDS
jgi:hypothetical protein